MLPQNQKSHPPPPSNFKLSTRFDMLVNEVDLRVSNGCNLGQYLELDNCNLIMSYLQLIQDRNAPRHVCPDVVLLTPFACPLPVRLSMLLNVHLLQPLHHLQLQLQHLLLQLHLPVSLVNLTFDFFFYFWDKRAKQYKGVAAQ